MNPRYRNSTKSGVGAYPFRKTGTHFSGTCANLIAQTAAALAVCAVIATCDAADRPSGFVETGQPRDLVNRPDCWIREHSEEWYRCAVGVR